MGFRDLEILRLKLCSTTDAKSSYTIEVNKYKKTVTCNCSGFQTHGFCKHIKFYRSLINSYLDQTSGVEEQ
jgi:hypothetical protein